MNSRYAPALEILFRVVYPSVARVLRHPTRHALQSDQVLRMNVTQKPTNINQKLALPRLRAASGR